MQCRLTVSTSEGVWQSDVDDWTCYVVLAALSAEPETFGELAEAVRRYQPEHELFDQQRQTAKSEAMADGLWCLVDLAGRTVVAGAEFELPDPHGAYERDADEPGEGFPIVWLDTPEDWLFRPAGDDNWSAVVAERAATRTARQRLDARAVFFGRPLLEHLAAGVLEVMDGAVDEEHQRELTRTIHARWLMTTRADLGERTPREVLLTQRHRIDRDLEHRCRQWSLQRYAPPALPPDSVAYRLGGFGITEVVLYFDLVRALLAEAWKLMRQEPRPTQPLLVERLAAFRDRWLQAPPEGDSSLMATGELIELERRRMPVASDGSDLFDDCPICQVMAEEDFGPTFMHFDGHHLELEDEFAFSLWETREELEREQEELRKFSEEMDRKARERAAEGPDAADPLSGSVWQRSFVDWDLVGGPEASPRRAMMAFSFPLAELVSDLQERPDGAELFRSLNRTYGSLRSSQDAVATNSAAQQVRELLEEIARKFPELTPKCADLQSRLDEILRQLS